MTHNMHTLSNVANIIGESYSHVWHAYAYGRVPAPLRVGRTFVLTDTDITGLRDYFAAERSKRVPVGSEALERTNLDQENYATSST